MQCISNFKFVKDNATIVEVWNSQIDTKQEHREVRTVTIAPSLVSIWLWNEIVRGQRLGRS